MKPSLRRSRRWFLALSGSLTGVGLAGCTGDDDDEAGYPDIELISSEVREYSYRRTEENWIAWEVANVGDAHHGRLNIDHTMYDENGTVIDAQTALIDLVPAGETYVDYRLVHGSRREEAATVESTIRSENGQVSATQLTEIDIVESKLHKDFRGLTEITGQLKSGDVNHPQVYLVGLIYTSDGTLRGSVGEILRDIEPNTTRAFRIALASHWTPQAEEDHLPTEHQLLAFDNIP